MAPFRRLNVLDVHLLIGLFLKQLIKSVLKRLMTGWKSWGSDVRDDAKALVGMPHYEDASFRKFLR
jgi:hypothetical protein